MSSVVELRCRTRNSQAPGDDYEPGWELANDPEAFAPEEVRAELRRVVNSPRFETSERNRRFLEYVVDETLAGRADRIKAYNIATTVFGRDATFDAQLDPVVRMEARRLRSSLERFYLTDEMSGSIKIELPKGAYMPLFKNVLAPNPPVADLKIGSREFARDELGLSILVMGFESEGGQPTPLNSNNCLARHLIIGLSRFPEFVVFVPEGIFPGAPATKHKPLPTPPDAEFMLTGSTAVLGDLLEVNAMLVHPRTGRVLWAQGFHRDLRAKGILSAYDDIANGIVRTLAEPFGAIFSSKAQAVCGEDHRALTPLEHVIRFQQYRRGSRQDMFAVVRKGLERSVIANPDYAETISCLSLLYTDAHRFGFTHGDSVVTLRRQAVALAHKAIGLAPNASRGYHALGLAYWFMQDVDASLKALQSALSLNPNATEIMADLGLHWALLEEWEKGVPLLEEASARDPGLQGANRIGLSLYHFAGGRFGQALAEAEQIRAPHLPHGFVAKAISLVRLGRKDEAAAAAKRIEHVAPSCSRSGVLAALAGRNVNRNLANMVSAALDDAILPDGPPRA